MNSRTATLAPNWTLWFGAGLEGSGDQGWLPTTTDAIGRMAEKRPPPAGAPLRDALDAREDPPGPPSLEASPTPNARYPSSS